MDYDSISKGYNELYGEEQLRKARLIKKHVKVKKTDLLLDVGCGSGIASSIFLCNKIGIDPSLELLRQTQMPVVQGKGEKLPFGNQTFDLVLCITALHNFTNPLKGIKEMKRVAKGKIVISVLKKSAKKEELERIIKENLEIFRVIDEEKDTIYFCK